MKRKKPERIKEYRIKTSGSNPDDPFTQDSFHYFSATDMKVAISGEISRRRKNKDTSTIASIEEYDSYPAKWVDVSVNVAELINEFNNECGRTS